jgi:shikimate 5-dehydrogenase
VKSIERYRKLLQDLLKLDIAYVPINSGDDQNPAIDPSKFAAALKGMPCLGGSISRDIKHTIIPYLDEIDDLAFKIQSVNTVTVKNGILKGYNTDAFGFQKAIIEGLEESKLDVRRAVCYGYGGVASVVTTSLRSMGIEVYLTGRKNDVAQRRAEELGVIHWCGEPVDLFINATPASTYPLHLAPNFVESLKSCRVAFDHEMPGDYLAEYCTLNNIYHIQGVKMYYPQMIEQWTLFLDGLVDTKDLPRLIAEADTNQS